MDDLTIYRATRPTLSIAPEDLAVLLGSRLCHDLVSPLGAIGNGLELLELSGEFPGIAKKRRDHADHRKP